MMRIDADLWFLEAQFKIGFVAKRVAEKFLSRNATELGHNFCGAFTFLLKKSYMYCEACQDIWHKCFKETDSIKLFNTPLHIQNDISSDILAYLGRKHA